jgi:DNA-binding NarL/FixJ family response regulator
MEAAGSGRPLTHRETEILKLAAAGLTDKEIAHQFEISDKTVRNHMANLYEKLNIHSRAEAVVWAIRLGLIEP